jgi:F-type H+-transporting ATPase subunit delta
MSSSRIALRYAKPLLLLAEEKKVADKVHADMASVKELCHTNRAFVLMLKSPIIKHLKKAEILNKIFKGKVHEITLAMFNLMARKNREAILPELAEEFVKMYHQKLGFQEATVTTSFKLESALKKEFEKVVAKISGKKPVLNEVVNPELIGGYVLKMDDRQIDASVSGHLNAIKLRFKKKSI